MGEDEEMEWGVVCIIYWGDRYRWITKEKAWEL